MSCYSYYCDNSVILNSYGHQIATVTIKTVYLFKPQSLLTFLDTVCPEGGDPFYTVTCCSEWVITSWAYSSTLSGMNVMISSPGALCQGGQILVFSCLKHLQPQDGLRSSPG